MDGPTFNVMNLHFCSGYKQWVVNGKKYLFYFESRRQGRNKIRRFFCCEF